MKKEITHDCIGYINNDIIVIWIKKAERCDKYIVAGCFDYELYKNYKGKKGTKSENIKSYFSTLKEAFEFYNKKLDIAMSIYNSLD